MLTGLSHKWDNESQEFFLHKPRIDNNNKSHFNFIAYGHITTTNQNVSCDILQ